jgi:hypothetical protein
MGEAEKDLLRALARRYVWWKTPDEAIQQPHRIIAQVMNIGDFDDVVRLTQQVSNDVLIDVLTHAEIGQFDARSWHYWHYRLGLAEVDKVPAMPIRDLGG